MTRADRSELLVLAADLARIEEGLEDARVLIEGELRDGSVPDDPHVLAFVAITLVQYYNAFEDGLQRVARCFEGRLPDGEAWHSELLRRATLELSGVRPAVIDRALFEDAREMMRFRHFLRHAYGVRLAADKIKLPVAALGRLDPGLRAGLERVRQLVAALLEDGD